MTQQILLKNVTQRCESVDGKRVRPFRTIFVDESVDYDKEKFEQISELKNVKKKKESE